MKGAVLDRQVSDFGNDIKAGFAQNFGQTGVKLCKGFAELPVRRMYEFKGDSSAPSSLCAT